jgi:16S rRNA (cytidine1402-2'-O)-methyltransferase
VSGTLFLVGTPIGNLEDVSDRARRVLGEVGVVAAEDTRRTGLLLKRLGVSARMVSLHEANERTRVGELVRMLADGTDVAVVTDAGMPGISDPGYRLVAACVEAGVDVDVVPGPSAAIAALVISGLPTDRFVFEGFLPRSGRARAQRLASLANDPRTAVLFESPRRVAATLADLLEACGDRPAAVCREMTKLHQEVFRGPLSQLVRRVRARERDLRGEVTVVLGGAAAGPAATLEEAVALAAELASAGARKRDAAKEASARTGVPARAVYAALVEPVAPPRPPRMAGP